MRILKYKGYSLTPLKKPTEKTARKVNPKNK